MGYRVPVAVTRAVWVGVVEPDETPGQSVEGRLWDVLWMLHYAIRTGPRAGSLVRYQLYATIDGVSRLVTLKAVIGPGDEGEPPLFPGARTARPPVPASAAAVTFPPLCLRWQRAGTVTRMARGARTTATEPRHPPPAPRERRRRRGVAPRVFSRTLVRDRAPVLWPWPIGPGSARRAVLRAALGQRPAPSR